MAVPNVPTTFSFAKTVKLDISWMQIINANFAKRVAGIAQLQLIV